MFITKHRIACRVVPAARGRMLWLVGGLTLAVAVFAYGQTPSDPAGVQPPIDPSTGTLPTFVELFMYSPYINGIIAGLSVLALALFLGFMLTINGRAMAPSDLIDELTKLAVAGRHEQAVDLCRRNRRVFVASIVQRCVENSGKPHSVVMGMIDSEGRRRADIIWNRISYLADVSNVAPMLGLLGTVLGMIRAFFLLESQPGNVNAKLLSAGVGQAMATTMFGLVVGIGALVLYSIVKGRTTRTLAEAEAAVHAIADHVKRDTP